MSGPARSIWQHGMSPVKQLRYSITMRTIKDKRNRSDDPRHQPQEILKRLNAQQIQFGIEHPVEADEPKQLKLTI